jgi:phosphohistidine phosphatase
MELYLLRHGIAEDERPGKPDAARELTDEGREKTAEVVKLSRAAVGEPSLILSSPLIRAHQTAKIAAKELGYRGDIELVNSLVPNGTPEQVWADVRDRSDEKAILLAGHEPSMSALVAYFLNSPSLRVDMKKSALVRIDFESAGAVPRGVLRWMVVPKLAER